ncbi:CobQ/CobB/MinD/ParA nucleotide binding domain protein [Clostridium tepidiprofundi DSM 19306]|uniref:CobQ/CobB/MinD/ParA nucleotide binding domain protein n=1 Tax=Clostridium tepidiprofundi DSM 19306 TaxID=1121338 RepID=A0A151B6R3_9CLOT|nr:ParA family protein [Clostridium tepidiprofundi]KYH35596.1 CobQ/CobB/MinD/ParA nucleotide binding domain protein [Clostridium tepidiprofundi DSM 19306]
MKTDIKDIVEIQESISAGEEISINLPKYKKYTICNLRGGIGKTTLAFNLSYLARNVLAVDTCAQGNLSYFYDNNYFTNASTNVKDMILPYIVPGLGKPTRVACRISATNQFFDDNSYYIPSSDELYILPSQLATALNQANNVQSPTKEQIVENILLSLRKETDREMQETGCSKCLIDTSPFFSGATHLAWHASDALIIPVRTDQQSINSLNLLLKTLKDPSSDFRRNMSYLTPNLKTPKIQMIILTHCTWSTQKNAKNKPNQQTKVYIEKVKDIVNRNITSFTTDNPDNHIFLLDDFLGTGRISSALSKPVLLLQQGESMRINKVKTTVNASVEKCKNQLRHISNALW